MQAFIEGFCIMSPIERLAATNTLLLRGHLDHALQEILDVVLLGRNVDALATLRVLLHGTEKDLSCILSFNIKLTACLDALMVELGSATGELSSAITIVEHQAKVLFEVDSVRNNIQN